MIVTVRVKPSSSKERIVLEENCLTVRLKSKPVDGKANAELMKLLKRTFGDAALVSGQKSRTKRVEIPQETLDEVREILQS